MELSKNKVMTLNGHIGLKQQKDSFERQKGLNWVVTALFVVGDLAGGGLVALPTAMVQSGFYTGVILSFLMTLVFGYTSYVLGQNWVILQRNWPVYRNEHCRNPYPEIGRRALGRKFGRIVSTCINLTQFGISVVYLLLASKNIHHLLKILFNTNISFCAIIMVVAVLLLPVTFLKSPQDFWPAVVIGMFTTTFAVILILIGSIIDFKKCYPHSQIPDFRMKNYLLGLGTILFSYGGHSAFPTIQHDMKKPHEFTKTTILAFLVLITMYMPVSILGSLAYGNSLRQSIINSIQSIWIQQAVNILITAHCILTLTIAFNPINQEAEHLFNTPQHFGLKRVIIRSAMLSSVVFVAETVPVFGPVLDLVGASTMNLSSLIFPCLFYLCLKARDNAKLDSGNRAKISTIEFKPSETNEKQLDEEEGSFSNLIKAFYFVDKKTLFCCTFVIAFAVIGGASATFSAIHELSYANFVSPCYISAFTERTSEPNTGGHINCCGASQNITVFENNNHLCAKTDFEFYS